MEAIKADLVSHQIGSFSQRSRYESSGTTPAGVSAAADRTYLIRALRQASHVVPITFSR